MLNYRLASGLPSGSRAAWSRLLLLPLSHGPLSPLSYSLLAEVTGRAWFQYYDRIEFDPMPRARVVRQSEGSAYFNLTLSAQREAEQAARAPIAFVLNGEPFGVAKLEKGGFLAGLKSGRAQNRQEKLLAELLQQRAAAEETARAWHSRIVDYRWTQAEILQIMEEIEPTAAKAFVPWMAGRQQLLHALNRLLRLSTLPPVKTLELLDAALGAIEGVTEIEIARRLHKLGGSVTPALRAWVAAGELSDPAPQLTAAGLSDGWAALLADYGHRSLNMGELAEPRWFENPAPLLRALVAPPALPQPPSPAALETLLAAIDAGERKAAQATVAELRAALLLQSAATDALAWVLAGARRWAAGAAREANADTRIVALDDVFLFELEELKQMMTNEWNTSDRTLIQGKAVTRKAQFSAWQAAAAPDLFIGDSPAEALDPASPSPLLDATRWYAAAPQPIAA